MSNSTLLYPRVSVDQTATGVVSAAGSVLLIDTIRRCGVDRVLSQALAPWRPRLAVHDPGKVLLDLAISLVIGGDCLADIAVLRAEPGVFGLVASDPTVSRTIDRLAADAGRVLAAINTATSVVRQQAWALAGEASPVHAASADAPVVIDLDATLVTAHSEKQHAAPTYKRGFGFHPLLAFADHGDGGTGEPVAALLRPGNAGANTAADHLTVIREALAQLPFGPRPGRKVLIRTDSAGGTHQVLNWLTGRRLQYSVGFRLTDEHAAAIRVLPEKAWTPAHNPDGIQRDGAWVAEATGVLDLSGWPAGMRVLVRAEHPHPGAQLRFTDLDGNRLTALATNTPRGQLADLELRHRRRARPPQAGGAPSEDRIRCAKDTGLTNFPLYDFDQNRIWPAIVMLAGTLTGWLQLLALRGTQSAVWEPKRLRLRLFSIAGRIARRSRQTYLRLSAHAPWGQLITTAIRKLNRGTDLTPPPRPIPTNPGTTPRAVEPDAPTAATRGHQPRPTPNGRRK